MVVGDRTGPRQTPGLCVHECMAVDLTARTNSEALGTLTVANSHWWRDFVAPTVWKRKSNYFSKKKTSFVLFSDCLTKAVFVVLRASQTEHVR